jgi:general secretion pathway protein L
MDDSISLGPISAAPPQAHGPWQRLLVFVPARRSWHGGSRGALSASTVVRYVALQADGRPAEGSAALAQLPRARALELVFDSLDVFSATIDAPRLGEARLRQALPNLLEERMLGDPTDHHFASMPCREEARPKAANAARAEGGAGMRLSVAAISRSTLARALEICQQLRLQPRAAYSEIYTLPRPRDGTFSLRIDGARALLRTGQDQAVIIDGAESASDALQLARRSLGIQRLEVYRSAGPGAEPARAFGAGGIEAHDVARWLDPDSTADAVNLLQGPFAGAGGYGRVGRVVARLKRDGAWKAPAAWTGVCALVAIGGLNAYWFKLDSQMRALHSSVQHAFRDAFPNETPVDELAQARRDVSTLKARAGRPASEDFSSLNAQAAQMLTAAPVGVVAGIEYANGRLAVHFLPGSMDNPAVRNALQARALSQSLTLSFDADGTARIAPAAQAGE